MKLFLQRTLTVAVVAGITAVGAVAQQQERAKIPEKYKWNLAEIYPSDEAWRAAKDKLAAEIPRLRAVPGHARVVAADAGRRARPGQPYLARSSRALYVYASLTRIRTRASARTRACSRR